MPITGVNGPSDDMPGMVAVRLRPGSAYTFDVGGFRERVECPIGTPLETRPIVVVPAQELQFVPGEPV